MDSFFNLPNLSGRTGPLDLLTLTEISIRSRQIMFLGNSAWLVRRADNLTAISEPIVYIMWNY
jgi:hypothetical protein